jgi:hypothetical protein
VVRFGQAEAADPFAGGELRQVFLLLRVRAEFEDRHHHERRLHGHHRPVAGVDALDFARDQAVADVVEAGAAVFVGDRRAEQAQFAHFAEYRRVGALVAERLRDARRELVLRVRARGIAHHPLLFGQLLVEQQRIVPMKSCNAHRVISCRSSAALRYLFRYLWSA